MADYSVVARNELHGSEASEAKMFYFDNSSPGKSCFVVVLVYFLSSSIKVFVFVNTTRTERNLPEYKKSAFFVSQFASEGKIDEGEQFLIAGGTVLLSLFATFQQGAG